MKKNSESITSKSFINEIETITNIHDARRLYKKHIAKRLLDVDGLFKLAGVFSRYGALEDVVACCKHITRAVPNHFGAFYNMGVALCSLGYLSESESCFRTATETNPEYIPALINLGIVLVQQGRSEEALDCFNSVLTHNGNIFQAHHGLGLAYKEQGNFMLAEASLRESIRINPGYSESYYELGNVLLGQNLYVDAIRAFTEAARLQPGYTAALFNIAHVHSLLGNNNEAIKYYRIILESDPDHSLAANNLGWLLEQQGHLKDAVSLYKRALRVDTKQVRLHLNLGRAYLELAEYADSEKEYSMAIKLDPESDEAYVGLGQLRCEQGEFKSARNCFERSLQINPENEDAQYYITAMKLSGESTDEGFEYLDKLFNTGVADKFDKILVGNLKYSAHTFLFDLVSRHYPEMAGKPRILDLGCGTGLCGEQFNGMASYMIGVDISAGMLEKARAKNIYDDLIKADITEIMRETAEPYDLVISTDVFIYVGNLTKIFALLEKSLAENGYFAFSIESTERSDYVLRKTGRYAHSCKYIRKLCRQYGLNVISETPFIVRYEKGNPVAGYIFILKWA